MRMNQKFAWVGRVLVGLPLLGSTCFAQSPPAEGSVKPIFGHYPSNPTFTLLFWILLLFWLVCAAKIVVRYFAWVLSKRKDGSLYENRRAKFGELTRTLRRLAGASLMAGSLATLYWIHDGSERIIGAGSVGVSGISQSCLDQILGMVFWCSKALFTSTVSFTAAWVMSWIVEAIAKKAGTGEPK